MLPELEQIIFGYLDAMHEGANLPSISGFKQLIKRSDTFVLNTLGFVIGMPTTELVRLRYNLLLCPEFCFCFQLTPFQRRRLITLLKNSIWQNVHCSALVWACIGRNPPLCRYSEYRSLFVNSLLVKLIFHLEPRYPPGWLPLM